MYKKVSLDKYKEEIEYAQRFLNKHNDGTELRDFLKMVKASKEIHSQKWSMVFDYMYDHYKDECMHTSITTGLSYLVD